jgi:hypothetical protein
VGREEVCGTREARVGWVGGGEVGGGESVCVNAALQKPMHTTTANARNDSQCTRRRPMHKMTANAHDDGHAL